MDYISGLALDYTWIISVDYLKRCTLHLWNIYNRHYYVQIDIFLSVIIPLIILLIDIDVKMCNLLQGQ